MYNRYDGNTGRFVRVPDPEPPKRNPMSVPGRPSGLPSSAHPNHQQSRPGQSNNAGSKPAHTGNPQKRPPPGGGGGLGNLFSLGGLTDKLEGILPKLSLDELETEDFILMLMLYLMYKESGDKELLIMLGAVFLL